MGKIVPPIVHFITSQIYFSLTPCYTKTKARLNAARRNYHDK
nr:MAG TPA_asm: hypothetical protein [Caudoviricetes sp.]